MTVRIERDGPVTTVIIDRPEVRNAVDAATALALRRAFAEFEVDREAAVAVLAGAGGCFCAGYDLKSVVAGGVPDYDPEGEGPTDRTSAHRQWDRKLPEALKFEGRAGEKPLRGEAGAGAARFARSAGRGGDFGEI